MVILAHPDFVPALLNRTGVGLLWSLSIAAILVSPLNPMSRRLKLAVNIALPPVVGVYWYLFIKLMISLNPHVTYYLSPAGSYAWKFNTGVCCAFGIAFSIDLCRTPLRAYGVCWFIMFLVLLMDMKSWMPALELT